MKLKKTLSMVVSAAMLMSMLVLPAAHAAEDVSFADIQGHWGQAALERWNGYGVVQGDELGNMDPDGLMTRGTLAVMLDRVMGYQLKAENTFTDLKDTWYTDGVLGAAGAGVLRGDGAAVHPEDNITRQETAVVMARVLSLTGGAAAAADFVDGDEIASWATDGVASMAAKGYMRGFEGAFRPAAPLTRAEMITILDNVFKGYDSEAKEYTGDVDGSVVITAPGVTVKNAVVTGDVIVAEGVAEGDVKLEDVTVTGRLLVRGGGQNSVELVGKCSVGTIVVEKLGAPVRVVVGKGCKTDLLTVSAGCEAPKLVIDGAVGKLVDGTGKAVVSGTGTVNGKAVTPKKGGSGGSNSGPGTPDPANAVFVAATGSNETGNGSKSNPYGTIQHAIEQLEPGDTLCIRGGTYYEKLDVTVSGAEDARITIQPYNSEKVILDGSKTSAPGDNNNMVLLNNVSYVTIQGLEICNNSGPNVGWDGAVGIGVYTDEGEGGSFGLELRDNKIHHIDGEVNATPAMDGWFEDEDDPESWESEWAFRAGHAICVYGGGGEGEEVGDIVIDGNEVYLNRLGQSEAIVVNGNVEGFEITNNYVHDNDNIGIDVIGGEGTCEADEQLDRARDGVVAGNIVANVDARHNLTYNGNGGCDGIYVDGGYDVDIENNFVYGSAYIGIEIASENGSEYAPTGVSIRNNIVAHCVEGLYLGGSGVSMEGGEVTGNLLYENSGVGIDITKKANTQTPIVISGNTVCQSGGNFLKVQPGFDVNGNLFYGDATLAAGEYGTKLDASPVADPANGGFAMTGEYAEGWFDFSAFDGLIPAKVIQDYKDRQAAGTKLDAVVAVLNAGKGTEAEPIDISSVGGNLVDYLTEIAREAVSGAQVFMKHTSANFDADEYATVEDLYASPNFYYGVIKVDRDGTDGDIDFTMLATLTESKTITNCRLSVRIPYGISGGFLNAEITGVCLKLDPIANGVFVDGENGDDDSGDGSEATPYETIAKGLADIGPGKTLYVREGTYGAFALTKAHSGTKEAPVVIAAYPGETVKIEAPDAAAGIKMTNVDHITVMGFDVSQAKYGISYESTTDQGATPLEDVFISGNKVHDIVGTHGICVYARNYLAPMHNVIMEDNEVYNCRCGSSESTVFNGNIDGFIIRNNVIHDNNNIGIDMIGFEGTAAMSKETPDRYQVDFVRNGECYGNVIYNISAFDNEAYWTTAEDDEEWYEEYREENEGIDPSLDEEGFYDLCADGIYVDGGQDIKIYENFIYNCDIGIEVATEHKEKADPRFHVSGVEVYDNVIAGCQGWAGICFGGYDYNLGFTHGCTFRNNTLVDNMVGIAAQRSYENLIENNLVVGGSVGFDVNDLENDGEDYVNDNEFGVNYWIDTEDEEDFRVWLDEIGDEDQAALQVYELDGEVGPDDCFASPLEEDGIGSAFTPAREYVGDYVAMLAAAEGMEAAAEVVYDIKAAGITAADLEEYDNDLIAYLEAALAGADLEMVKVEMMRAPVNDPDQLILWGKGGRESYTDLLAGGSIDADKVAALEEETEAAVSVRLRYEYAPNSYWNLRISMIPVTFPGPEAGPTP